MNAKGQMNLGAVAIAALIFLFVLAIYGQFQAVTTQTLQTNSNIFISGGFNAGVISLINLLPLVIVGSAIVGIVILALANR